MKKFLNLFVGAIALLLGMGFNLQYALNDYGWSVVGINLVEAQTTGGMSGEGWTSMTINCYDKNGNVTGHKVICYQPGYRNSCSPTSCK